MALSDQTAESPNPLTESITERLMYDSNYQAIVAKMFVSMADFFLSAPRN
jgi:hypothetical protein